MNYSNTYNYEHNECYPHATIYPHRNTSHDTHTFVTHAPLFETLHPLTPRTKDTHDGKYNTHACIRKPDQLNRPTRLPHRIRSHFASSRRRTTGTPAHTATLTCASAAPLSCTRIIHSSSRSRLMCACSAVLLFGGCCSPSITRLEASALFTAKPEPHARTQRTSEARRRQRRAAVRSRLAEIRPPSDRRACFPHIYMQALAHVRSRWRAHHTHTHSHG